MPSTANRLLPADAARYARLRLRMLTEAPWAFSASPDDDVALDVARVADLLADEHNAIFAVADPAGDASSSEVELVAAAGVRRMKGAKFSHRAQLWGVFVEPAHRGRGLGRQVVEAAIGLARSWNGVDYVDLGVSENAPEALRLYESLGFRAWGREPETTSWGMRRFDEIYMTLRL
jgi:ribosomal protein S18 acetylase RimI-like enzyme